MENVDLKLIKKLYGEKFAYLCRNNFSTILEDSGHLTKILTSKFEPTHSLYEDLVEQNAITRLINYVHSFYAAEQLNSFLVNEKSNKTAEELFDEAGYILFPECKTEEDVQKFKHWYNKDEELCTFYSHRLETARVWFAVKKNCENIKRENFTKPQRQDEYGTSVISIQFTKGDFNYLSIKNRYNHIVDNPDATFNNNLDNIIPGLTHAFIKDYNINPIGITNQSISKIYLSGYCYDINNKMYRFNLKLNNFYFCEKNIIIDPYYRVTKLDTSRYLLVDNYVFDLKNNRVINYDKSEKDDAFVKSIGNDILKISVKKWNDNTRLITITPSKGNDIKIVINKHNELVEYYNSNIKKISNDFLRENTSLKIIDIPNVVSIGDRFLIKNNNLTNINLPKIKKIGQSFLSHNVNLADIYAPNLKSVGSWFLTYNKSLTKLDLPNIRIANNMFCYDNNILKNVNLPKLKLVRGEILRNINSSTCVFMPKCKIKKANKLELEKN